MRGVGTCIFTRPRTPTSCASPNHRRTPTTHSRSGRAAKRDGRELDDDEVDWLLDAYTRGLVPDEQMSAFAMAVLFRGMTDRETARWTSAMVASGGRMDFSGLARAGRRVPTVDKHSTGGVGDAVTLVLTPLLATWDVAVPQLSGRG